MSIYENEGENSSIATLSSSDADSSSWTYSLVSGEGATDNTAVSIGGNNGNEIILSANPNSSVQENYSVRVQVTDNHGNSYEEIIEFKVIPNLAPIDIIVSDENGVILLPTYQGESSRFDLSTPDTVILENGSGDWTFIETNETAQASEGVYVEFSTFTDNTYMGGTWGLNDSTTSVGSDPYDVLDYSFSFSGASVNHVQILELGEAHSASISTYEEGDIFAINIDKDTQQVTYLHNGTVIYTSSVIANASANYSFAGAQNTENAGIANLEFSAASGLSIYQNEGANSSIATLSSSDADSSSWTYSLVSGEGATDNTAVSIGGNNGNEIILSANPNSSVQENYSVRVQVTDNHGQTFEKVVEFKVLSSSGTTSSDGDFTFGEVDNSTSSLLYTWGQAVQKFTGHTFGDNELNIPDITLDNLSDNTIVVLSNIQIGMVIFDKSNPDNTFTSSIYNTSVDVSSWNLENLSVNVAQNIFTHVNSYSYGSVYRTDAYQEEITLSVRTKDATSQEQGVIQEVTLSINVTESARWISSPIILDLDHDGIETLGLENAVRFDIDADGDKDKTGWVGADDGLLVRDINGDGIINDASELFGEETIKNDGTKAKDGYDALKEMDSNNDGVINKDDELFDELKVWRDLNSDGITDENEMISLEAANVSEISLEYEESNIEDKGNIIGLQGSYKDNEGNEHDAADVWFSYDKNSASEGIDLDINRINNSTLNLNNDKHDIINLKFDELIASTNEDDELIILGERGDTIILEGGIKNDENEDGKWEQSGTKEDEEGKTYSIFQSTNGTSIVKLLIEEDIDIDTF